MVSGRVLCARGGRYDVEIGPGEVIEASLRGRIKKSGDKGERVVVGDRVEVSPGADEGWTIDSVLERRHLLVRRAPGKAPRPKPLVANLDLLVVVFAAARPEPNLRMLDRFLVLAESSGIPVRIVVNKIDLAGPEELARFAHYPAIGYPVLHTSVERGEGIATLLHWLRSGTSAFAGPSGVGKSSLLNAIEPGLALRVGSVGVKGRHTTVTASLVPLAGGGYVADTPGLREVGLWKVPSDTLDQCFPEMRPLAETCRFGRSCTHRHEPDCAVKEAVAAGEISRERYDSYGLMYDDAVEAEHVY